MKQNDKKKKKLDPEIIKRFMEARRLALQSLVDQVNKEDNK